MRDKTPAKRNSFRMVNDQKQMRSLMKRDSSDGAGFDTEGSLIILKT